MTYQRTFGQKWESFWENALDFFMMRIAIPLMLVMLVMLLILILSIPVMIWNGKKGNDSCIRQHKGIVYHPAYTSMMIAGKVIIPIYHPAHESEDWICDERRP